MKLISTHNFDVEYLQEGVHEWKFKDIDEYVEFHMTHSCGQFGYSHFNVPVLREYYKERNISFKEPFMTVILKKLQ